MLLTEETQLSKDHKFCDFLVFIIQKGCDAYLHFVANAMEESRKLKEQF